MKLWTKVTSFDELERWYRDNHLAFDRSIMPPGWQRTEIDPRSGVPTAHVQPRTLLIGRDRFGHVRFQHPQLDNRTDEKRAERRYLRRCHRRARIVGTTKLSLKAWARGLVEVKPPETGDPRFDRLARAAQRFVGERMKRAAA